MRRMSITCPETAHLEQIGYERHRLGMLIVECSRFSPACEIACPRTCARQFDLKARLARRRTHRVDE